MAEQWLFRTFKTRISGSARKSERGKKQYEMRRNSNVSWLNLSHTDAMDVLGGYRNHVGMSDFERAVNKVDGVLSFGCGRPLQI